MGVNIPVNRKRELLVFDDLNFERTCLQARFNTSAVVLTLSFPACVRVIAVFCFLEAACSPACAFSAGGALAFWHALLDVLVPPMQA